VKIKPAGAGELLNAKPIATASYKSFDDLTPVSTATVTNPDGDEVADVSTEEGVRFLRAADGHVVHAVAVPSTSGEVTLTDTQATQAAEAFAARNTAGFANDWKLVEHTQVSHVEGDAITLLRWRPLTAGHPGSREVTIEIDNRTGAVVYYGASRGAAQAASFQVTAGEAIAAARAAIGDDRGTAEAVADTWNRSRWTVTIDRGLTGEPGLQVPDVEQVEIDAVTGQVISRTKT
jgi:Peptidase propeptide and YPEB domain.